MCANCPECERETKAAAYDDEYGDTHATVWCPFCGWNTANSAVMKRIYQLRTSAALGLNDIQFQALLQDEARQRWLAADPELAPF